MAALKDSGARREFESGAVRDCADGKGRCDLLPLSLVSMLIGDGYTVLIQIGDYIRTGDNIYLEAALNEFAGLKNVSIYTLMLEASKQFEDGASKYGERNWEQGIPLHCYIDSAVRHYLKFKRGDTDEPHDRAFVWNILCAMWTQRHKPELIDLPFAQEQQDKNK